MAGTPKSLSSAGGGGFIDRGLLLDSHAIGEDGGSGHVFDWGTIPTEIRNQITLAGGLSAQNVAQAIEQVRPFAVDISSGFVIFRLSQMTDYQRSGQIVKQPPSVGQQLFCEIFQGW